MQTEWMLYVSGAGFKSFGTLDEVFAEVKSIAEENPEAPLNFSVEKYVEE